METEYTYAAFISYSSKDEKAAKALWKKLERYRLPAVLQKQYEDVPDRLHIFLDQGDIVPGDTVENALSRELADSRKLIVVCSPNSAKAKYVELEVNNFLKLGHSTNDIIPYIIDGEVGRNRENNCYVPSLYGADDKDTLNGVSVVRDGKWKAFVGVLANLLDVKFDEIYRRERVRRNRLIAAWSTLGALAACCIALFFWYVTPHTKYYTDYVTRWGIPEGICRLSKKQLHEVPSHYEITTQFWRPVRVIHANPKGFPVQEEFWTEKQNRPVTAEYRYRNAFLPTVRKKNWLLKEAVYHFERQEDLLLPKNYTDVKLVYTFLNESRTCHVDFYYNGDDTMRSVLYPDVLEDSCLFYADAENLDGAEIFFFKYNSTLYRLRIDFTSDGCEKRVSLLNKNSIPVSDKNGILSWSNTFDAQGRLVFQQYDIDKGFQLQLAAKEIEYEGNTVKRIRFLGSDGKPVRNFVRKYAEAIFDWQKTASGSVLSARYLDAQGSPCAAQRIGGTEAEEAYNKDFLLAGRRIRDVRNNEDRQDMYTRDEKGRIATVTSYKSGKMENARNIVYETGSQVRTVEILNEEHEPVEQITFTRSESKDGLRVDIDAKEKRSYSYDRYKRLIEQSIEHDGSLECAKLLYFGDNKSLCWLKDGTYSDKRTGFARADFSYSNEGNLSYIQFRRQDGSPASSRLLHFSEYKAWYSPGGFRLHESFYNQQGKLIRPMLSADYAVYEAQLNLEESFVTHGEYRLADGAYPAKKSFVAFDTTADAEGNTVTVYKKSDANGNLVTSHTTNSTGGTPK
ncbi:MAG: toll/interleukin-1 receptor domain-containing protein [Treponema sp.]|nr:toll/interleukin-1 receptor domain-containing protein [Treponema sp.]